MKKKGLDELSQFVTACDEDIYSYVETCLYIYVYICRCAMKKGA